MVSGDIGPETGSPVRQRGSLMAYQVRYFQSSDGASIAAARGGSGSPVVISPMFGTSIEIAWQRYVGAFPAHELITWDRRGFGLSERGSPPVGAEQYLQDAEVVVDGLGLESFAVVGTLAGTIEATSLAARRPGRVGRLVLRAPVSGLADWAEIPGVAAARAALAHDWEFFTEAFGQYVVGWGDPAGPQMAADLRAITTREELTAMFDAFVGLDLRPMYGAIEAATLVEHHPRYFFPDRYSRSIASQIANCTLSVYDGAGADFMSDFSAAKDFLARSASLAEGDVAGARTIMFTDLEASTELTQRLGDRGAQEVVHRHDVIVRKALADHGGREIKRTGDGIMASFSSAFDAVVAAQQIRDAAVEGGIGVHVGLNTGEPIVEHGDLFGTAVQLAARITDRAEPGQVLVSNVVRELCAGKGLAFEAIGPTSLKGFDEPVQLYAAGGVRGLAGNPAKG